MMFRSQLRRSDTSAWISSILGPAWASAALIANGAAVNVDAFYDAFDVKEGDGMWLPPEDRVKIW